MFGKPKINIEMINPSSKISLKLSCLMACGNDLERAEKLYSFLSDGMDSIPDFDVPKPTTFEQIKNGAGQFFGWIKDNKEDIVGAYNFIQQMRQGTTQAVEAAEEVTEEIPPLEK